MRRLALLLLTPACTAPPDADPLALVRARVWAAPAELASDPDRFDDMRALLPRLQENSGFGEVLVHHRDGWLYVAGATAVCGVVVYLDAGLHVRDIETFMAQGSLRTVTPNHPGDPLEVLEDWHSGPGLDRYTRFKVHVVEGRIVREELAGQCPAPRGTG
jgi:hypothetical protein